MSDREQYDKLSDDLCEISKIESDLAKKRYEYNFIQHLINETTKTIFSSDDKILKHLEQKIPRVEKINQKTNKLTCNKCGHKFGRPYHLDSIWKINHAKQEIINVDIVI